LKDCKNKSIAMKIFNKLTLAIAVIAILSIAGMVYALNSWNTGFRIDKETKNVYIGSSQTCYKVTNTSNNSYFIPTKTTAEWNAFAANLPSGVSIGSCCASHAYFSCYAGDEYDVYWYDSCGNKEEKKEECGKDEITSLFCKNDDIWANWIYRGCSGNVCTETTDTALIQDCSEYNYDSKVFTCSDWSILGYGWVFCGHFFDIGPINPTGW
jgi:hypothetical protein